MIRGMDSISGTSQCRGEVAWTARPCVRGLSRCVHIDFKGVGADVASFITSRTPVDVVRQCLGEKKSRVIDDRMREAIRESDGRLAINLVAYQYDTFRDGPRVDRMEAAGHMSTRNHPPFGTAFADTWK